MKRSSKLLLYAGFAAVTFLAALILGRPELAALGAPFALFLVVGLSLPPPARVQASLRLDRERALEGEEVEGRLEIVTSGSRNEGRSVLVQPVFLLPQGLRQVEERCPAYLRLQHGGASVLPMAVACGRWGAYRVGDVIVRTEDRLGLRFRDAAFAGDCLLKVYPRAERLPALVRPLRTQAFAGNRVAKDS